MSQITVQQIQDIIMKGGKLPPSLIDGIFKLIGLAVEAIKVELEKKLQRRLIEAKNAVPATQMPIPATQAQVAALVAEIETLKDSNHAMSRTIQVILDTSDKYADRIMELEADILKMKSMQAS